MKKNNRFVPRRPQYRARITSIRTQARGCVTGGEKWWVLVDVLPSGREEQLFYVCRVRSGTAKLFATIAAYLEEKLKERQREENEKWQQPATTSKP